MDPLLNASRKKNAKNATPCEVAFFSGRILAHINRYIHYQGLVVAFFTYSILGLPLWGRIFFAVAFLNGSTVYSIILQPAVLCTDAKIAFEFNCPGPSTLTI